MTYAQGVAGLLPDSLKQPWCTYVEASFLFYTRYGYSSLAKKELDLFFQKNNAVSASLGKTRSHK